MMRKYQRVQPNGRSGGPICMGWNNGRESPSFPADVGKALALSADAGTVRQSI